MILLGSIIVGILIGVADCFLIKKEKKTLNRIGTCIGDAILVNMVSYCITKNIFGISNLITSSAHISSYPFKVFALTAAVGVAYLVLQYIIVKNFVTFTKPKTKRKKTAFATRIIATVLFALGVAAFTGTLWGKEAFGDLTPDQIIINLNSPIEGTDPGVYISLFEGPVLTTVTLTVLFCLVIFPSRNIVFNIKEKKLKIAELVIRLLSLILALAIFIGGCVFGINRFQLLTLFSAYFDDSPYIEENFVDPNKANLKFPEEKRNLIHIYLESMENTFFSKELGGYFEENLMPDLAKLCKEGYSFSHLDDGFGGPPTSTGGNWSVASMVNMNTGLPMKVPFDHNAYGTKDNFLPGATTLGDILKEQGYEQSVMFGADASFGGLDFYFESHGDFNIYDHKAAKELGWIPEDYKVFWGYEDDKLYEYAKKELTRLSETGKPFHFVMETADTHAPEGYLSEKAEKKFDTQYANCIYYSQAEAVKFVRWIQDQPFYENTTIVLIGDHLSMAKSFFENVKGYKRTCFNLFINPPAELCDIDESRFYNRDWAVFDMFPTLVACLGVEFDGNRLGIGTNLFSGEQTLFERDGVKEVNKELENRSNFYNKEFLFS